MVAQELPASSFTFVKGAGCRWSGAAWWCVATRRRARVAVPPAATTTSPCSFRPRCALPSRPTRPSPRAPAPPSAPGPSALLTYTHTHTHTLYSTTRSWRMTERASPERRAGLAANVVIFLLLKFIK